MDRQGFWDTIARARAEVEETYEDTEDLAEALIDVLAELEPADIADFDDEFQRLFTESYRVDLWAAAYLICGGASDDGFDYFRAWLIGQGRTSWDAAVADPDSLAGLLDPDADADFDGESLMYAASTAYERVADASLPPGVSPNAVPDGPVGDAFDFDDDAELQARLPRLFEVIEALEAEPDDEAEEDEDDEEDDDEAPQYGDAWTPRR
ncbi:DUF4240 domain-containing protein [Kribbella antibiotica]|uniref:DUF4240 domain-containing protein n=1 Tax=Kribbella antibiotica TaxID=190195 RepID=A0A4R4ZKU3_9ACTN|nr:DUF4240 domain-containing protein [Kribbella antibiotica]TDD58434.1 DUF4240 domain-containing protein [Kribbella antibiotica]